ncbi:amidohydrolase [Flammeovirga agarivorans]|uniref:Omega-amidase YafV n=1 Tax=Flammeovirga agarivorans TaxID=2726742 RepID=A0A7X8XWY4_9BACT|nr:amidohydrolase [Flammeovirga agarivorans]NLR92716.1 amidohydrolase [Flammeovirga agarivorans]
MSQHQENFKIALVQFDPQWMNPTANLALLEEKLWTIDEQVDLVVLPELFTTGFHTTAAEKAEPIGLTTSKWLMQQSKRMNAAIIGSFPIRQDRLIYNRSLFARPNGHISHYDKRHLFRMASEHMAFTHGKFQVVEEWKGWRINPIICYDLRFPLWCRNTNNDYDILLCLANWPKPRIEAWDALLKARAIENLSYTVGVNRVGNDPHGVEYNGQSAVYNPKGQLVNELSEEDEIQIITLSYKEVQQIRESFPTHLDADHFTLQL